MDPDIVDPQIVPPAENNDAVKKALANKMPGISVPKHRKNGFTFEKNVTKLIWIASSMIFGSEKGFHELAMSM
jgi:hypothetical protein